MHTDPTDQARHALLHAEAALAEAADWYPQAADDIHLLAAHLRGEDETGHAWAVTPEEAVSTAALRSMHVAAHAALVRMYEDDVTELETPPRDPDPSAWATEEAYMIAMDPAAADAFDARYEAFLERQMTLCSAEFVTPGPDPWSSSCDKGLGHYPHTKHGGPDPLAPPGSPARVSWRGGGSAGGDALPYTDVTYTGRAV